MHMVAYCDDLSVKLMRSARRTCAKVQSAYLGFQAQAATSKADPRRIRRQDWFLKCLQRRVSLSSRGLWGSDALLRISGAGG
jgi:hypothetical protein